MLIISKLSDYYDGVVGTIGVDKTIVYKREFVEFENEKDFPKEFKIEKYGGYGNTYKNHFTNLNSYQTKSKKYEGYVPFIVGFCGKLYIGWKFYYKKKPKYPYDYSETIVDITYDLDFVKKHVDFKRWNRNLNDDINYVLNYDPINIFRDVKAPVFIYDFDIEYYYGYRSTKRFYINPLLKKYHFYKVLDTYTTFQEIQMFISGVLGTGEKEIIEVDNKHKITQHGFDKWSFRKEPTKKR